MFSVIGVHFVSMAQLTDGVLSDVSVTGVFCFSMAQLNDRSVV